MSIAVGGENSTPTGVLLVGHGTRSELGQAQCQALAAEVAGRLEPRFVSTELAYLEMASPTIEETVLRLVEQRIERLVVVPLLLFAAGHAKEDVPSAVSNALVKAGMPNIPMVQTEPLGLQDSVVELATARFHEAADPRIASAETMLLLIGRGSRDEGATAEMRKLGSLVHQKLGIGESQVGFLAMAQPTATEIIAAAANGPYRQIVVQPHLLFHGELLDRLQQQVSAAIATSPGKIWRLSRVLGEEAVPLAQILRQAILSAGNK
ncbi:MAG: sirohydrochlorin chelatase [Pirellulaceae bacterium]